VRLAVYHGENAELVAQLVNDATPAQREAMRGRPRGYAADFGALPVKGFATRRG